MRLFGARSASKERPTEMSKNDIANELISLTDQLTDMSAKLRELVNETIESEKASDGR